MLLAVNKCIYIRIQYQRWSSSALQRMISQHSCTLILLWVAYVLRIGRSSILTLSWTGSRFDQRKRNQRNTPMLLGFIYTSLKPCSDTVKSNQRLDRVRWHDYIRAQLQAHALQLSIHNKRGPLLALDLVRDRNKENMYRKRRGSCTFTIKLGRQRPGTKACSASSKSASAFTFCTSISSYNLTSSSTQITKYQMRLWPFLIL